MAFWAPIFPSVAATLSCKRLYFPHRKGFANPSVRFHSVKNGKITSTIIVTNKCHQISDLFFGFFGDKISPGCGDGPRVDRLFVDLILYLPRVWG